MKFEYTGIEVKDMDASIACCRDGLGMEFRGRTTEERTGGEIAYLKSKDSPQILELNWSPKAAYRERSELDHLAFECEDVEGEVRRPLASGAALARPVEVRTNFVLAFVKDPNGIWIELYAARPGGSPAAVSP